MLQFFLKKCFIGALATGCLVTSVQVMAQGVPGTQAAQGTAPKGATASDQNANLQAFAQMIGDTFQRNNGLLVCSGENANIQTLGDNTLRFIRTATPNKAVDQNMVQQALFSLYPCPFSPYRRELAPATLGDVSGAWVFPTASQRFRFPPRAQVSLPTAPKPVVCDGIGFFDKGEHRRMITGGTEACPFTALSSFASERKKAAAFSWKMLENGRVAITRNDKVAHVEEWDALTVKLAFEQYGVKYQAGDLIMYLRRSPKNTANIAEEFRHLQRLN